MSHNSKHNVGQKNRKSKGKGKKAPPGVPHHLDRGEVYWSDVDPSWVYRVVIAVTECGGAIMLVKSSDGGALGARVYHDDHDVATAWGRPEEEFEQSLSEIADYYEELNESKETP